MVFQKYVYAVINTKTSLSIGCYPNFKKAYERIEDLADGRMIVDNGWDSFGEDSFFDVIDATKKTFKYPYIVGSYRVCMMLLTIYDNDATVSYEMVQELKEDEKKRKHNATYRLKGEVM